jgi:chromate transporter
LGWIAFGGPAAHIALMEEEFVCRRAWVTGERFLDLVGAVSLLPGPNSTEMAIYLGQIRGGTPGLLIAGALFILPAALLAGALAWVYQRFGSVPQVAGLLFGVKPVVVMIVAQAVWSLGRAALKSLPLAALAAAVVALFVLRVPTLILLIGGGIVWLLGREISAKRSVRAAALPLLAVTPAGATAAGLVALFAYFLKVGALLFGSGYVLLAFLRADLVVRLHWLSDAQLLDAVAVSQATPGPFFTVSTFLGYLLGGWRGASLATLGMFLPAFLLVAGTAAFLPRLRRSRAAGSFLDGVNAAAVALMGVVGWQFGRAAIRSLPALALAAAGAVLLFRQRVNSTWLILGGAAAGLVLGAFGWAR